MTLFLHCTWTEKSASAYDHDSFNESDGSGSTRDFCYDAPSAANECKSGHTTLRSNWKPANANEKVVQSPIWIKDAHATPGCDDLRTLAAQLADAFTSTVSFDCQFHVKKLHVEAKLTSASSQPPPSVQIDGTVFELLQFHAHRPHEHRFTGDPDFESEKLYLEIHLVFQKKGEAAPDNLPSQIVLGLLFEGATAPAPSPTPPAKSKVVSFKGISQAIKSHDIYSYDGTLTQPPLPQNSFVRWFVIRDLSLTDFEVDDEFLRRLKTFPENNRFPFEPAADYPIRKLNLTGSTRVTDAAKG